MPTRAAKGGASPSAPNAAAPSPSASAVGPDELDDIVRAMHTVVLREAAGAGGARTTPVGREMARAIVRVRGAALGARALARDDAANGALRYLFRDVAARLADVWRDAAAEADPERSALWPMRAELGSLEDVYEVLGLRYSDPLEPKLGDVGAIYDAFARTVSEEEMSMLCEEIGESFQDIIKALRARVDAELALFPAALKARVLRAMGMAQYEQEVADLARFACDYAAGPAGAADAMERAVRALGDRARAREAIARDAAAFARTVFGDVAAGVSPSDASPTFRARRGGAR